MSFFLWFFFSLLYVSSFLGEYMQSSVEWISWFIAAAFFAVIVWATVGEDYDRR
jgi:hypothetical protein